MTAYVLVALFFTFGMVTLSAGLYLLIRGGVVEEPDMVEIAPLPAPPPVAAPAVAPSTPEMILIHLHSADGCHTGVTVPLERRHRRHQLAHGGGMYIASHQNAHGEWCYRHVGNA